MKPPVALLKKKSKVKNCGIKSQNLKSYQQLYVVSIRRKTSKTINRKIGKSF